MKEKNIKNKYLIDANEILESLKKMVEIESNPFAFRECEITEEVEKAKKIIEKFK